MQLQMCMHFVRFPRPCHFIDISSMRTSVDVSAPLTMVNTSARCAAVTTLPAPSARSSDRVRTYSVLIVCASILQCIYATERCVGWLEQIAVNLLDHYQLTLLRCLKETCKCTPTEAQLRRVLNDSALFNRYEQLTLERGLDQVTGSLLFNSISAITDARRSTVSAMQSASYCRIAAVFSRQACAGQSCCCGSAVRSAANLH